MSIKSRKPSPTFISRASLFMGGLSLFTVGFSIISMLFNFPVNEFVFILTLILVVSTPPLAIILGIIALFWNKTHHTSGNKFAIAAIVIGFMIGIGMLFVILVSQGHTLPGHSPWRGQELPPLNP